MLQTDKEAEEVIKVNILGSFCLLVGAVVKQRRVLPVTASWLYVLVRGGVSKSVCQRPTCGRISASFAYMMYTQLFKLTSVVLSTLTFNIKLYQLVA